MKKKPTHIEQVETLVSVYGSKTIANILGVSDRAIQLWMTDTEREPRRETLKRIAELFAKHSAGEDLGKAIIIDNWKEELIKNAIENHAMSRVILMALAEILANQRSESVTKVLSELTKVVEAERVSG